MVYSSSLQCMATLPAQVKHLSRALQQQQQQHLQQHLGRQLSLILDCTSVLAWPIWHAAAALLRCPSSEAKPTGSQALDAQQPPGKQYGPGTEAAGSASASKGGAKPSQQILLQCSVTKLSINLNSSVLTAMAVLLP